MTVNPAIAASHRRVRERRSIFQRWAGRSAGHENRQRDEGDDEQDFQPDLLQRLVAPDQGHQEKTHRDERPKRGDVVQNQMQMRGVHSEGRHRQTTR
jgi:hypothetical protein